MRSSVPSSLDGDDKDDGKDPFASCYWWRSLPEYEADGVASPSAARLAAQTPRLRVIKEMERLAFVSQESLADIRHRLLSYRAGDLWFPAGGVSRQETDIPAVITILLLGFAGSGKSSLVNLMYSVLGRSGIIPFAQTTSHSGKDGRTMYLEEHNVMRSMRNGFCVFDSRGLDYDELDVGLEEVGEWIEEGVCHRQPCRGAGVIDAPPASSRAAAALKQFVRRRVNCVMAVVSLAEIHISCLAGDMRPLDAVNELFHARSIESYCNDQPILVLTHGDELGAEERVESRIRICEYLGVSEATGVYDVACINEHGALVDEMDPVTAYALAEAVYRAVAVADRCHPPKRSLKDWAATAATWAMSALSALFALLAEYCSTLAKRDGRLRRD